MRLIILTFLALTSLAAAQESDSSHFSAQRFQGLVVTQLDKNGEGAKSGLRESDILLGWSQGVSRGLLRSPFDLLALEIEEKHGGSVSLEGLRGTERKTWVLGAGPWSIRTRPDCPENLFLLYDEGLQLARAGKWPQTIERWHGITNQTLDSAPSWFAPWLFLRAAEVLSEGRQWPAADDAFKTALNIATDGTVKAHILRPWAKTYELRSEWAHAEECYQKALGNDSSSQFENLAVATDLSSLGSVALARSELPKAESYFQRSLKIREAQAPGSLEVATGLHDLGIAAFYRSDLDTAQNYFHQSLSLRERLAPGSMDAAASFTGIATVANYRSNQTTAEEYYRKALKIHEELAPDSMEMSKDLLGLGNVTYELGDLATAEEYFRRSWLIRERIAPGSLDVAKSLSSLGNVTYDRGDLAKSAQYYKQAYEIRARVAPGSLDVARSLFTQALVAKDSGNLIEAENYGYQALEIQKKLSPDSLDMASTLNNLGIVFYERGDLDKAEKYYLESLAIVQKKAPNSLNLAHRLTNLGRISLAKSDLEKARSYFQQSLAVKEKQSPESMEVATALNNLGEVAAHQSDWPGAEAFYQRALKIREKLAPHSFEMAWNLSCLGVLARDQGQLNVAEEYLNRALELWASLAPGSRNHAETLAELGEIKHQQGQEAEAAQFFEQSIAAIENQSTRLGGTQEIRAGFRSKFENYYKDYIALLVAMNKPELAFQTLERSRARTLLETLATAHVDIRQGIDPALVQKEHSLQTDLNAKLERRIRLLGKKDNDSQRATVTKEIDELRLQYRDVQAQIQTSSPAYAALLTPQYLTVQDVRQRLLGPDTLLLEYTLGKSHSYVFCVTMSSFAVYTLPNRSDIENSARGIHDLLASRNKVIPGETALQRQERWNHADAEYNKEAANLSAMIFDPIAELLQDKQILIVADGALQYVPFAALPTPEALNVRGSASRPMIVDHQIVNLPSASVLDVLRRGALNRQPARKIVAVLADPVFDAHDSRLASTRRRYAAADNQPRVEPESQDLLNRSAADMGLNQDGKLQLSRLLFSRREAMAILSYVPAAQSLPALDFRASKDVAISHELADYRIIHFATHGFLNSEHPELSGLVFSMVDEHGNPQDGFLQLQDIYNLNLRADLVVLSACETALGKDISGEGLIGLTRGFMYAGASRVVASLWKVSDAATASLMADFYRAMEKDGMAPAAALRSAQIKMWKQKRWNSPYYWAAFQIQGEWK
jgi:CHAT domain-containing protein